MAPTKAGNVRASTYRLARLLLKLFFIKEVRMHLSARCDKDVIEHRAVLCLAARAASMCCGL